MAILSGYNLTYINSNFNLKERHEIEKIPFVWNNFNQNGYVTAYAEDQSEIGTFDYCKKGFEKPPTNFYLRPFAMAIEKNLNKTKKADMIYCLGYQHAADFIYQNMLDFGTQFNNDSFFGFFWTSCFSHSDWILPVTMDKRIKYYLKELENRGILNTTAVFLISDHGDRYGGGRHASVNF
jgi:hypothetical protein